MHLYKKKLIDSFNFYSFIWQVTDALRISLSIILPVTLLCVFKLSYIGIPVGIGSLLISLVDNSDVWKEKKKIFQSMSVLFFLISFAVSMAWSHRIILGTIIYLLSFGFSMLHAYGKRWAVGGSVCIVLIIFVIAFKPVNALLFSLFVTIGALWSFLISYIFYSLWPFRSANRIVSECIVELGKFMYEREKLYDPGMPIQDAYKIIISGHEAVNAKQEILRSLILTDEKITSLPVKKSNNLLPISIVLIDLYEQIRVMPLDYESLRAKLSIDESRLIRNYIKITALSLIRLSIAKSKMHSIFGHPLKLKRSSLLYLIIKKKADEQTDSEKEIFKAIVKNIENISTNMEDLQHLIWRADKSTASIDESLNLAEFTDSRTDSIGEIWKHFTFKSKIFRFATRMAVAITTAYIITLIFPLGRYSYWIMLTVALVLRPNFSVTHKRNLARLRGTFIGIIAGLLFTLAFNYLPLQIVALCLCLSGFFYFLQTNYAISVAFITPFIIIGLSLSGGSRAVIASERIYDTLLGCALSFAACFIFPYWEVDRLKKNMQDLLSSNLRLIESKLIILKAGTTNFNDYKLSRKGFYINSARFTEMLKQVYFEPKRIHIKQEFIERFVILNYLLYASVSAIDFKLSDKLSCCSGDTITSAIEKAIKILKTDLLIPKNSPDRYLFDASFDLPDKVMNYNHQAYESWHKDYIQYIATDIGTLLRYMKENNFC